jgi:hypothetical protein
VNYFHKLININFLYKIIKVLQKFLYFSSDMYPVPQINHNRPADMVDYRLASITKTDNTQRYRK